MTFETGSLADYDALERALLTLDTADQVLTGFDGRIASKVEHRFWCELATAAAKCGWSFQHNQTCIDWSRRRVALIRSSLRRAA